LAVATQTELGLSGAAAIAPLLPAEFMPLIGDQIALSLHATLGDRIVVDLLSIGLAGGTVTGDAAVGGPDKAIAAHLRANVPELSPIADLLGSQLAGSASLSAEVMGTESRPVLALNLSATGVRLGSSGAEHVEADVRATSTDTIGKPEAQLEVAATGRIQGLVPPEGTAVPPELGRDLQWSLAAVAARDGSDIDLTSLSTEGVGVSLSGVGQLIGGGQTIQGQLHLSIAELRPFSGLAGRTLAGSPELGADAAREGATGFTARLQGSAKGLRTGVAAGDALIGDLTTISGSFERNPAGVLFMDQLKVAGGGPGVLDRLRGGLGLDFFKLGSGNDRDLKPCRHEHIGDGRYRAQRGEIHRAGGVGRRQPGHLAADQQGHSRDRGATPSDRRRRGRSVRRHRNRAQLQL